MEQKRLPFRFRIPWKSTPRPDAESSSRRTKKEPKLPFRPPGIAPTQPQPYLPSRPPQPPSPATTLSGITQSPSCSPSNRTSEVSKSTADENTGPSSSTSQQEKQKKVVPMSKQSQQMKLPFKTIPTVTLSQPQKRSTQHSGKLGNEERSATSLKTPTNTEKSDTDAGNSKIHWEEQSKFHQPQEKGNVVHKPKVGNAQDPLSRSFRTDKEQAESPETVERQMMFATSNPTDKGIKVVSSTDPTVSNVSSISPQKLLLPKGDRVPLQKEIREDISNCVLKLAPGHLTQPMDENPVNVTTLAGDNRGATMHIGSKSSKRERSIYIHRAYRKNPEQRPEVATDGEASSEEESDRSLKNDEGGNAYVNSNIQSLNNSLMCQSSINDRDPGVHLTLPRKHIESVKCDDRRRLENRKPEFKVSRNDGLRIRRRCLRGLFAEPSDSDPDNPNKPQRHGCKFKCGDI